MHGAEESKIQLDHSQSVRGFLGVEYWVQLPCKY